MTRRRFLGAAAAVLAVQGSGGCSRAERIQAPAVPRSPFGRDSTAEEVTAGLDLSGRMAVVTGCNSGLGYETMRVLAKRGARVVGTGRTLEKARRACASVAGETIPVALELGDFDSIVGCAEAIRALDSPVDMLICNAGMRGGGFETVNGVERHFAVNHLGHFLLVNRLIDRLLEAAQGRLVVVASRTAYTDAPPVGIDFDGLGSGEGYSTSAAYAQSKLANVLFSLELAARLDGTPLTANALHPGVINTNIVRNVAPPLRAAFGLLTLVVGKTVEQGSATACYVATSPLLERVSGEYFEDCNAVRVTGDHHLRDRALAERLWAYSEELTRGHRVEHPLDRAGAGVWTGPGRGGMAAE